MGSLILLLSRCGSHRHCNARLGSNRSLRGKKPWATSFVRDSCFGSILLITVSYPVGHVRSAGFYYLIHSTLSIAALFMVVDLVLRSRTKHGDALVLDLRFHSKPCLNCLFLCWRLLSQVCRLYWFRWQVTGNALATRVSNLSLAVGKYFVRQPINDSWIEPVRELAFLEMWHAKRTQRRTAHTHILKSASASAVRLAYKE